METLDNIDKYATNAVFQFANNNSWFDGAVTYGGLIPYELYVLPGMALAIAHATLGGDPTALRFHVLPHVFAFSFVGLIKNMVRRPRPGCYNHRYPSVVEVFEQKRKCKSDGAEAGPWSDRHGFAYVSFPSGHATVACAVFTGLLLYLTDEQQLKWDKGEFKLAAVRASYLIAGFTGLLATQAAFRGYLRTSAKSLLWMSILACVVFAIGTLSDGVDMNSFAAKTVVMTLAVSVAFLVSLHRIAKGYHHFFDSVFGAVLGACIGSIVYLMWPEETLHKLHTSDALEYFFPAAKHLIGMIALLYLFFFFAVETTCFNEAGCDLLRLANAEH